MNLDEAQRQKVAEWIREGLKLSEIQNRLSSELGVRMTYMEVRLLVDDLKLIPKDVEPSKAAQPGFGVAGASASSAGTGTSPKATAGGKPSEPAAAPGRVSLSVDQLTRPGALVSGKVTFSDGNRAEWYLDQTGQLGLVAQQRGYRPPAGDVQQFQMALESELTKLGF